MGWDDVVENSAQSADYVKIEDGKKVRLHLLDNEPFPFFQHRRKEERKPMRCKGKECPYCLKPEEWNKKRRFAIAVYNMDGKRMQILEQGIQVFSGIKAAWEAYEGDLNPADIIISRSGSNLDTVYTAVPVPTAFKPAMIKDLEKFDMAKIYGGQPNGKTPQEPVEAASDVEPEVDF